MRIISGSKARMVLLAPRDNTTRPITDRVKESLFGIIRPMIAEAQVADIFCGTGSLGLEALSRGAKHAVMVDADADACKRLRQNIVKLGFAEQTTVVYGDAFRLLRARPKRPLASMTSEDESLFDLVFVDPPYVLSQKSGADSKLGVLLSNLSDQVAEGGTVVVRQDRRAALLDRYAELHLSDRREYGSMAITFLEKIVG